MNPMDKSLEEENSLELRDASDLIEKQSVRATFRLSVEFIAALRALSSQLGIKQKSLFDHLMEDMESLKALANRAQSGLPERKKRIQKTFVISRKSLSSLDRVSKHFETSRDDLVEYSIQRLLPILMKERKKQVNRENAMDKISKHFNEAIELLDEILLLVGKDDPVFKGLDGVFSTYENAVDQMESLVKDGKKITDLQVEKLRI